MRLPYRRNELAEALVGTNAFGYAYDTIGNRTSDTFNGMSRSYAANCLNQYTQVGRRDLSPPSTSFAYDADGSLTQDDRFAYSYDAENRLISVIPRIPVEGAFAMENRYNHKNLRERKIVRRCTDGEWTDYATHDYTYDGGNIVLERVAFADGSTRTVEYFWGNDLSGTEQGAGNAPVAKRSGCLSEANPKGRKGPRVGGLIAVSIDGTFFIPCYDHNGDIVCYVSESGTIAAQYVYDPYGNVTEQYGTLADRFAIRFSTKYTDVETGLISYLRRFYRPDHGRWLNRDPIEERGGENLYAFCANAVSFKYDKDGCAYFALRPLAGAPWLGLASHNFLDDLLNTEIAHEHLFFEDGKSPSDYGLHGDIGQDGKQVFHGEDSSRCRHFERGYNDCVMRIAVANVKPKPYSVLGSLKASKYNCQDYCSDLRREYFRLLFDNTVRKKCCIRSKDRK